MQDTYNRTINTLQSLRAISEHSPQDGDMTSKDRGPAPPGTDATEEQAEVWSRRAANANGFGGMQTHPIAILSINRQWERRKYLYWNPGKGTSAIPTGSYRPTFDIRSPGKLSK